MSIESKCGSERKSENHQPLLFHEIDHNETLRNFEDKRLNHINPYSSTRRNNMKPKGTERPKIDALRCMSGQLYIIKNSHTIKSKFCTVEDRNDENAESER